MSKKGAKKEVVTKKPGQEFIQQFRYKNDLPPVPFDPKLLAYPHGHDRLYRYFESSIAKSYIHDYIHPDGDQGLNCNPFELGFLERAVRNPEEKLVPRRDQLDPKDLALLLNPAQKKETKAVPNVPWLHRPEFISTERSQYGRSKSTLQIGMSAKNVPNLLDLSVEQQVEKIEQSFEKAKNARLSTLKHPKHKDLQALEIFPIFPDFENWPNPYFLASYDENPLADKQLYTNKVDEESALEDTILKPLQDPQNPAESWLAFYAPTVEALEKIKLKRKLEELGREVPEEDYEHDFVRDFDPLVNGNEKLKYPFFLEMRKEEGGAFYHPIQTQMKLRKRRAMSKLDADDSVDMNKPTLVVLKNRALGPEEEQERREKMFQLMQRHVEEEE